MVRLRQKDSRFSAFAIRSVGHTPFAGAANNHNVITIDLRSINNISVNPNQTSTAVGAGSISNHIYATLTPMNLTVLRARVAGLGVRGFSREVSSGLDDRYDEKLIVVAEIYVDFRSIRLRKVLLATI